LLHSVVFRPGRECDLPRRVFCATAITTAATARTFHRERGFECSATGRANLCRRCCVADVALIQPLINHGSTPSDRPPDVKRLGDFLPLPQMLYLPLGNLQKPGKLPLRVNPRWRAFHRV
jgi:hypothetical protein